ncbi:hypothetical protein AK812_SmicGene23914 [Symbiodinium microadriaticum]|uniref:Membrane transporter protein n=1 Tax=Symbiodinium microadriaticum TaxID=2951 RepID=A0A1Q9DFY9_SYMMI|nr:hypothetical protein AK812_SmicGene23914 [Symbiodinium microadriaticum]
MLRQKKGRRTFALAKVAFDGLVALWRAKGGGAYSDPPQAHGAVCTKGATTPPAVEEAPETDVPEKSEKRLPPAPSWLLRALPGVGLVGGFLGGLCGMNGPPFILLTAITGLDKVIARNVFPMGQAVEVWTFRLPMLLVLGRIQLVDAHLYVVSFLAGSLGLWAGNALAPYVSQRWFERALLLFLVLSSLSVLGIFEGPTQVTYSCLLGKSFDVVPPCQHRSFGGLSNGVRSTLALRLASWKESSHLMCQSVGCADAVEISNCRRLFRAAAEAGCARSPRTSMDVP